MHFSHLSFLVPRSYLGCYITFSSYACLLRFLWLWQCFRLFFIVVVFSLLLLFLLLWLSSLWGWAGSVWHVPQLKTVWCFPHDLTEVIPFCYHGVKALFSSHHINILLTWEGGREVLSKEGCSPLQGLHPQACAHEPKWEQAFLFLHLNAAFSKTTLVHTSAHPPSCTLKKPRPLQANTSSWTSKGAEEHTSRHQQTSDGGAVQTPRA